MQAWSHYEAGPRKTMGFLRKLFSFIFFFSEYEILRPI